MKLLFSHKSNICIAEGIAAREMLIKTSCFDLHHSTTPKNAKELQYLIAARLKGERNRGKKATTPLTA
ncbi:hypothetical protein NGC49_11495 [Enterobacter vonholyi]|uniref:hypothetical protein n=1 Tax=Enterobacter vonholyi TaxID=2797505 RepID=UPI002DB8AAB0|nr:hypothetical protein [Enterobacter vonholyi]MEB7624346.1 hypothetical protein [Enterobacter vonholyi]